MPKLDPNNVTAEAWAEMVSLRMWAVQLIADANPSMLMNDPVQFMEHAAALVNFAYEETIPERSPATAMLVKVEPLDTLKRAHFHNNVFNKV